MIKTAVVILNWNGKNLLEKFLPSVQKFSNSEDIEIIVADNCSDDESVKYLKEYFPNIRIISLDKNYGFAAGYNRSLKQVDAKYFVLLNSDVEVTENWINPVIQLLDNDESIAAVMPKIRAFNNKTYFEYAGAAGGFIDEYGFPFCRGRLFDNVEKDNTQYDDESEIFWASGAALFVRSDLYLQTGGLDEDFFAHMEEIDFCWRMKNMGYKILYTSKSTVYHVGGASLSKFNPFKTYLNFRNNLFLLYKNLPSDKLIKTLFIRLIIDKIAAFKFLLSLEFGNFWAVIKAYYSFFMMRKKFRIKRNLLLLEYKSYHHKEIYNGSIVYDFFIRKIKTFKELKWKF